MLVNVNKYAVVHIDTASCDQRNVTYNFNRIILLSLNFVKTSNSYISPCHHTVLQIWIK